MGLTDFEETEVRGEAVDAESTEEVVIGEERNERELLKATRFLPGDEGKFLQAGEAEDLVATLEIGMAGFCDFGKTEGAHDFAELDGRHVLGDIGHPNAHGGIDREELDASESLAFLESG